jgi:hypothetical protein
MRVVQFGTYVFPGNNKTDDTSPGDSSGYVLQLPGGYTYDAYGTGQAHERPRIITVEFDIVETTTAAMQTARDAIRAWRGKRDELVVEMYDTARRWCYARLVDIQMKREIRDIYRQQVRCQFEVTEAGWRGNQFSTTFTLDELPGANTQTILVDNSGNRTVTNAIVTFQAGGDQVTSVRVICGACDWAFWRTIPAGQSLVVDCGARTVHLEGVDSYANFELQTAHATGNWLELLADTNIVTVEAPTSAADANIQILFYDGWE